MLGDTWLVAAALDYYREMLAQRAYLAMVRGDGGGHRGYNAQMNAVDKLMIKLEILSLIDRTTVDRKVLNETPK